MFISFFFFKQKTAYEMRISDWSSDVCSSDLTEHQKAIGELRQGIDQCHHRCDFEQADQRTQRALFVGARRHVERRRHHEQFAYAFVVFGCPVIDEAGLGAAMPGVERSEAHTYVLQSLMPIT